VLHTPDGRYIVVRGRLWRATNPHLPEPQREALVAALSDARRRLRGSAPREGRAQARRDVDAAKIGLGERGPVWWTDGAPDYNRKKMARNTPYAEWYARVATEVVRPDPEAPGMVSPTDRQQRVDHERSAPPIP